MDCYKLYIYIYSDCRLYFDYITEVTRFNTDTEVRGRWVDN